MSPLPLVITDGGGVDVTITPGNHSLVMTRYVTELAHQIQLNRDFWKFYSSDCHTVPILTQILGDAMINAHKDKEA